MAVNDFDSIAPFYDFLARLVFGRNLLKAQLIHIHRINPTDRVLILGGGTGKILEHLPECNGVDYVEKSKKMLKRAQNRAYKHNVNFIHLDFLAFETDQKYDVIFCPFFLDCFDSDSLIQVLKRCKKMLISEGLLIVVDFNEKETSQLLQYCMHGFFRFTSHLQSSHIKDIHRYVLFEQFEPVDQKFLYKNMLFSRLYRNL